jgi:long-chain fatty acid transport protein
MRTANLLIGCCVCATLTASATGFRLPDQDAFATARGEAFAATADNASAIYYNPAGLTQIQGQQVRGGVYGLYYNTEYTSPSGGKFENQEDLAAVPQVFYAYGFKDQPIAIGLGVYAPYGLSAEWESGTGFRTLATEGKVTYYSINPVFAWRVHTNLSIAAGLRADYAEIKLGQGLLWPTQPYDYFRFKGDDWCVGYNLGLLWKVHPKVSIGLVFKSTTTFDLKGQTEYENQVTLPLPPEMGGPVPAFPKQTVDAQGVFPFPLSAVMGISYRPTPAWNLEFNADYTGWSRVGTVMIEQASGFPPLLPQNVPVSLEWENSWYYEFGATRYFDNGWHVSFGYIFNENSVPDAHYSPLIGDLDRHFLSVGTGFRGQRFNLDLAYQFGYGPTRTVSGSAASAIGQTADGKYDFISHALFLSAGINF